MTTTIRTGDRIRLLSMPDDPAPIPVGSTGTIVSVTEGPLGQVKVKWDNSSRTFALIIGEQGPVAPVSQHSLKFSTLHCVVASLRCPLASC